MARRLAFVAPLLCALGLAAPARADVLLPPDGVNFSGLTGTESVERFSSEVGHRPSVIGFFTRWYGSWEYIFSAAERNEARLMLHLSTHSGYGTPEVISPRAIARGEGDDYLVRLVRRIDEYGQPVYMRLMAEMNQANNTYAAFNRDGSSRGPSHSTRAFKQAWRRTTLILRGGPVADIDARLAQLGLPAVHTDAADLPSPPIAMLWVPQTEGSPNIRANAARRYWPGGRYVDWVGTDFYSKFPRWEPLERFYREFAGKPFVFGEWALWGGDSPGFVNDLFAWMRRHKRVRMAVYNEGKLAHGPFRLRRYPRSRAALRQALSSPRWR